MQSRSSSGGVFGGTGRQAVSGGSIRVGLWRRSWAAVMVLGKSSTRARLSDMSFIAGLHCWLRLRSGCGYLSALGTEHKEVPEVACSPGQSHIKPMARQQISPKSLDLFSFVQQ